MMKNIYLIVLAGMLVMTAACNSNDGRQSERPSKATVNYQTADSTLGDNGMVTVASNNSVDETYQKLVDAIKNNEALSIIAQLDHQENAANVDMELRPTRVLMFGNPNLGTPLMQSGQTIGIDLPQKVLIYEDANGDVFLVYNDPFYLADRHDIEDQGDVLDTISNALQNLATAATSSQ
jgi:uncharacterized protein (DUF302 family)